MTQTIRTGGFPAVGPNIPKLPPTGAQRSSAVAPVRWCSNATPAKSAPQCRPSPVVAAARNCVPPMPALAATRCAGNAASVAAAAASEAALAGGPPTRSAPVRKTKQPAPPAQPASPQPPAVQPAQPRGLVATVPTTKAGRPLSASRRTAQKLGRAELVKLLLSAYYAEYNPSIAARTAAILKKWHGKEERLFERLERKYGIHPLEYWPEMAPRLAETDDTKRRLAVVLDLDETLIHSILEDESEAGGPTSAAAEASKAAGVDHFRISVDGESFTVNKRPGLHDFLRQASQLYDLYVYTAGARDYANIVVRNIDPSGQFFKGLLSRGDCVRRNDDFLKDIRFCDETRGEDLRRVVLVDNNPVSFTIQPANGISIRDFYDDPDDEELPVLLHLLRAVGKFEDVRVALRKAQSNPLIAKEAQAAAAQQAEAEAEAALYTSDPS